MEENGESMALCVPGGFCGPREEPSLFLKLKDGQIEDFVEAVNEASTDEVQAVEGAPHFKTCLDLASETGNSKAVSVLLSKGADPCKYNRLRKGSPFHFASKGGHPGVLRLLLAHGSSPNGKDDRGRTPLHLAALKEGHPSNENGYLECLKILSLHTDVELNSLDLRGNTPLHLAVIKNWEEGARVLLSHGALLGAAIVDGKTTKEIIQESMPQLYSLIGDNGILELEVGPDRVRHQIFDALYRGDEAMVCTLVVEASNNLVSLDEDDGRQTPLQLACENGLPGAVAALIQAGVNVNGTCGPNTWSPLLVAAHRGYPSVMRLLWQCLDCDLKGVDSFERQQTSLHKLSLREARTKDPLQDHEACLVELLDGLTRQHQLHRIRLDASDVLGNTALHYAASSGSEEMALTLLRHGASLNSRNLIGESPVSQLSPALLKRYLDECIEGSGEPLCSRFRLTFHFGCLAPPEPEDTDAHPREPASETEALWFLSRSSRHRNLLRHPLLAAFILLKWQLIRPFVSFNLVLYFVFVTLMSVHFVTSFDQSANVTSSRPPGSLFSSSNTLEPLAYVICCLLIILFIREAAQASISLRRYVVDVENWVEVFIMGGSIALLLGILDDYAQRQLASLVLLLSWLTMATMAGRHPRFSTYSAMFFTVAINYVKVLASFSLLLVAFALPFHLLLHSCPEGDGECSVEDFTQGIIPSILKTLVMMIGEFEYSSLPVFYTSPSGPILFFLFLFFISLVLLNLLNGVAVSDTQAIRTQAELVSLSSLVQLVSFVESMLLGDPLNFFSLWAPSKCSKSLPNCSCYGHCIRRCFQRMTLGRRTLLFPQLPSKEVTVTPEEASSGGHGKLRVTPGRFRLRGDIVQSARELLQQIEVQRKEEQAKQRMERLERMLAQLIAEKMGNEKDSDSTIST